MRGGLFLLSYALARKHTLDMTFLGSIYGFPKEKGEINCEHVIPQSHLKRANVYELRTDMINLYPCSLKYNSMRRNYPFSETFYKSMVDIDEPRVETDPDTFKRYFIPTENARGKIARVCLKALLKYPRIEACVDREVIEYKLIEKWDELYEPDELELRREWIIRRIQGDHSIVFP